VFCRGDKSCVTIMVIDWAIMVFMSLLMVFNFDFQRMSAKIKGRLVLSVTGVEGHLD
jgi:hypothetical protein